MGKSVIGLFGNRNLGMSLINPSLSLVDRLSYLSQLLFSTY